MSQEKITDVEVEVKNVSLEASKLVHRPDFKADGVGVWENTDKNGNKYLAIKIVGHSTIHAFKNEKKGGDSQ